jgi:coenzyme F420-reducing hydrogenase gamma subunit
MDTPTIAVWKFASCDGCQLTLLNCEDELLALAGVVRVAHFLEASTAVADGPYDVSLVEGSVTTPADLDRIHRIRAQSRVLVTIGACATAGGVQALRNFADAAEFRRVVYARPEYVATLARSTPISAHVAVDHELRGCPISRHQLLELLGALLAGRRPNLPTHSVCFECKLRGTACLLVSGRTPCLGPVTQAGCGALCPAYGRGCYGCFGPMAGADTAALAPALRAAGMSPADLVRVYRTFNAADPVFAAAARAAAGDAGDGAGDDPGDGPRQAGGDFDDPSR